MKVISIDFSLPTTYYLAEVREATEEEKVKKAKNYYTPHVCQDGKCYKWCGGIDLNGLLHTVWSDMDKYLHIEGRKPDGWDWNGHPFYMIDDAEYNRIAILNKRMPIEKEFSEAEEQYHALLACREVGSLITEAERKDKAKAYRLGALEGGEGVNPFAYARTFEQFEYWERRYSELKEQLAAL